jgi:hypothetical protein
MKPSDAINATSLQGGTTANPCARPMLNDAASVSNLPLPLHNHELRPDQDRCAEDRTLEDQALTIQHYRKEYDRAFSKDVYDTILERACLEHRDVKPAILQRCPDLLNPDPNEDEDECEDRALRTARRPAWPQPIARIPRRMQCKSGAKGWPVTTFMAAFCLTVTPLFHDCIFANIATDSFPWIFSAECSAFLAAVIAWLILHGRRTLWQRLGVTAGLALGLGLGIARLVLSHTAGRILFTIALANAEIVTVLLFAWNCPARRR